MNPLWFIIGLSAGQAHSTPHEPVWVGYLIALAAVMFALPWILPLLGKWFSK